ncbi:MAG: hypothetical protein OQJ96_00320 [Flavobacteriales bacterium]|nr:hypothetical protein [Flavobacteriales bacterium]MCW8912202.1 hypothetical protein [Flavobacteriales bacterium]MCW8938879.1 hypothetical protein [Flavobacteriales bacterium]MCW8967051.1 hypothetical protein [Flavobacteriales bacterium]MCW8990741.1 hypothetical protein [Flavobacteriales bacterium]
MSFWKKLSGILVTVVIPEIFEARKNYQESFEGVLGVIVNLDQFRSIN